MAKEKVYEGNAGLYSEEDFKIQNKKIILFVLAIVFCIATLFGLCIQNYFRAGIYVIIDFIAIIVLGVITKKEINICLNMSATDALYRVLSEHFVIDEVKYVRNANDKKNVYEGKADVIDAGYEKEKKSKGIFYKESNLIIPTVRIVGKCQDMPFVYDQYRMHYIKVKKELVDKTEKEKWSPPYSFLKIAMPERFSGTVLLTSKEKKLFDGFRKKESIETEDIEFNQIFNIDASTENAAFRLLTHKHILKFKDVYEALKKKYVGKSGVIVEFNRGFFLTNNALISLLKLNASLHKVEKLDKYRRKSEETIDYIKFFVNEFDLKNENYKIND